MTENLADELEGIIGKEVLIKPGILIQDTTFPATINNVFYDTIQDVVILELSLNKKAVDFYGFDPIQTFDIANEKELDDILII